MGMHALVIDRQEADLDDAVLAANLWVAAARPIIKAMFALEDVQWDIRHGCDDRTGREGASILAKPVCELRQMIDGIRDDFLCDHGRPNVRDIPEELEAEILAFNDELAERTLSVAGAIKLVGDEQ
jgi:hypothetical protein